jgi:hypothetical protein
MPDTPLQNSPLALRDIHLPEAISWWPPAPGWWIVSGLVLVFLAALFFWYKYQQGLRIKKTALLELEKIRETYHQNLNPAVLARSISTLLRRVCLSYYPDTNVPGMTGAQWLDYLDSKADTKGFQTENGNILALAPYVPERKCPRYDAEALLALSEAWIQTQPKKGQQQ